MTRLEDHWWCVEHREVHVGKVESWSMSHRTQLHPVYVEFNQDRLKAAMLYDLSEGR